MPEMDGRPERHSRSSYYDADVIAWLRRRGERIDRSVDWQIREILREKMVAECREMAS
jgi:plasmid stability protein